MSNVNYMMSLIKRFRGIDDKERSSTNDSSSNRINNSLIPDDTDKDRASTNDLSSNGSVDSLTSNHTEKEQFSPNESSSNRIDNSLIPDDTDKDRSSTNDLSSNGSVDSLTFNHTEKEQFSPNDSSSNRIDNSLIPDDTDKDRSSTNDLSSNGSVDSLTFNHTEKEQFSPNDSSSNRIDNSLIPDDTEKESIITQLKPQMRSIIKTHQIEGISFMLQNVAAEHGCILAHSMGLGKTMQVIGLCDIFLKNSSKTVLIVTPVNTIRHFLAEFNFWLPLQPDKKFTARNFNVYTITDSERSLQQRCKILSQWCLNGGVLILGYEMFRLFMAPRKRPRNENEAEESMHDTIKSSLISSNLVVCDEAHRIKHMDTQTFQTLQQLNTKLRIVLTGYPLQNNLHEYFALINFVVPNFLGNESEFKDIFEKPIIMGQYSDSSPAEVQLMKHRSHILQSLMGPLVHRRCENILRESLPPKSEYTLFFKMTSLQKELYKKVLELTTNNPVNAFSIICKIMNDPYILFDYLQNDKETEIDIEDEDKDKENVMNHKDLRPLIEGYVPELIESSPKMIALFQMIDNALQLNEKMIIFSQSLLTLNMLERCLQIKLKWKRNLHYYRIDGSISQLSRQNMIVKFNQNLTSKVFLLSTKAGCLGITLVAANHVVLFDASFNPSDDLHSIGRIYRYGQKNHTFIYKFVMDDSLERSIFDHQIRKQQMARRIIDRQNCQPHMSLKAALSSYFSNEKIKIKSSHLYDRRDVVLNNVVKKFPELFTEEPLLHESLLIDTEDNQLTRSEAELAFAHYLKIKAIAPLSRQTVNAPLSPTSTNTNLTSIAVESVVDNDVDDVSNSDYY